MRLEIDAANGTVVEHTDTGSREIALYSREGFELVSRLWVKAGWSQQYPYTFSWFGRPIIQLPEDMVRTQEVLYRLKPDVIVETGVAHGGSLIYYASLCRLMGKGRIIGVDIEIRAHNRAAIEAHEFASSITLLEGSSTDAGIVEQVRTLIAPGETVLVILDSNHTRQHVLDELECYHGMVTRGSYIVATDGIMRDLHDVPRGEAKWVTDNPAQAANEFAARHPEFVLEQPEWPFNQSQLKENITHWPDAWLRRV